MKTFLADIIPKIQRYSEKLDNMTLLVNQHWVVVDELKDSKYVYIFRSNNELLISQNGLVEKGRWEYLGNNSLLIDKKAESYLFRHGFFDETVLALKTDGKEEYAFLVNEIRFGKDVNSIDDVFNFLEKKYILAEFKEFKGFRTMIERGNNTVSKSAFGYKVLKSYYNFDINWGNYYEFVIEYFDKQIGSIFQGKKTGKYFYVDRNNNKCYCDSEEEAAKANYEYLMTSE